MSPHAVSRGDLLGRVPPVCSIIIPVYNDPGYLPGALDSVLAQTLDEWEAIVVDDGSGSGDVGRVVERVGDARFRFIRHEGNRGLAAARNSGIRLARARIIVPLDSDDELTPTYLERVVPLLLDEANGYNCAFTDYWGFGGYDNVIRQGREPHQGVVTFDDADLVTLLRSQWIPAGGGAFTRELWVDVGGYCEEEVFRSGDEDFDFWIGALEVGLRPVYLAEPLYRYRTGHPSLMTRTRADAWRTHEAIYRRHRAIYDQNRSGRRFLIDGYVTSSTAMRVAGRRREAVRLAARGLLRQPWRADAARALARAMLPASVHRALRTARHRARGEAG
jgi:glycosyltransferase involved in cell wall biosynthesis